MSSRNSTSEYIPNKGGSRFLDIFVHQCSQEYYSQKSKTWKQSKCPVTNKWTKKNVALVRNGGTQL
jgi:hypothetical protein